MKFYGYHGVYESEQIKGQNFFVDVELLTDLKKAGKTDDLDDTVNYAEVFDLVRNITENRRFRLVEKLADTIASEILSTYDRIKEIVVRVRKPDAPMNGELDWAEVEIKRLKDGS